MERLSDILRGPWRAVPVLGVTQILAWGFLWYPPTLIVPLIAAERGWSFSFGMAGFSLGMLTGGLCAPAVGRSIDRLGGHVVMTIGSLAGAAGLVLLSVVAHPVSYFATWMLLGGAMAASLYDSAFATLGRIFGKEARRPITLLTFAGGFASTVGWPSTQFLIERVGWRGAYLTFAAILAFVAAPLHAFVLPRMRAAFPATPVDAPAARTDVAPTRSALPLLVIVAVAFAAYAFITSGLSAHMLTILTRGGVDVSAAVAIGALFGPAQVLSRLCEFFFGARTHPLLIARFAVVLVLAGFALLLSAGIATTTAIAFVILFGLSNGLITIARGTVPLVLFGPVGYGQTVGKIARGALVLQSAAPLVLASVIEWTANEGALVMLAIFAATAFIAFLIAGRRAAN